MNTTKNSTRGGENVYELKARIQELEKQVFDYKTRLDDLRRAKNNYIVKKEKEYVQTGPVIRENPEKEKKEKVEKSGSIDSQLEGLDINNNTNNNGPCQNCEEEKQRRLELERIIDALNDEIEESRNLVVALKVQNEEAKTDFERQKRRFQDELADACYKEEHANKEVKKWEVAYKEWMTQMEERVNHLMAANALLQKMLDEQNPENRSNNASGESKNSKNSKKSF